MLSSKKKGFCLIVISSLIITFFGCFNFTQALNNIPQEVYVNDDNAFVFVRLKGLLITDVSNPDNPSYVSFIKIKNVRDCAKIITKNNTVYILASNLDTDYYFDLYIIDITSIENPQLISTLELNLYHMFYYGIGVSISGNYLYIADNSLYIIDISDNSNPTTISTITDYTANDVAAVGSIVYLACDDGLVILDVSSPESEVFVGNYSLPDAKKVCIEGTFCYLFCQGYYIECNVIDITNTNNMHFLGSYKKDSMKYLCISSSILYFIRSSSLFVIDLTDPSIANELTEFYLSSSINGLFINENYAYYVSETQGLGIIDITTPNTPELVSNFTIKIQTEIVRNIILIIISLVIIAVLVTLGIVFRKQLIEWLNKNNSILALSLAIVSFLTGIFVIVLTFVSSINIPYEVYIFICVLLAVSSITSLILGIIGIKKQNKKRLAIAGVIISSLVIITAIIYAIFIISLLIAL
ncbi:MAG: hypothetical protein EAX90_10360 [Candidatus Heimdallarchaeota archaeon]|nr:hypothetical protein [Candidatus Heimdallarchaeota archaeon]